MTPDFSVSIGGEPLTDYLHSLFAADLAAPPQAPPTMSLSITDNAGGESDKFNISFARSGYAMPPRAGDEVLVSLGYKETGLVEMGKFIVDRPSSSLSKSGGRIISISATSADMTGTLKEPRTESYKTRTLGAVVQKIAGRHGLQPVVSQSLMQVPVPQADQTHESDMHFLSRLARDLGANFKVAQGRCIFIERRPTRTASGTILTGYSAMRSDILSVQWEGGERQAYKSVEAAYFDQEQAKRIMVKVGSGAPKRALTKSFTTKEQAQKAANAELKHGNASKDTLEVQVVGNPYLRADDIYKMPDLEPEYQGEWSIQKVEHALEKQQGFTSNLSLERPQ